jgi:hypothetical protein
MCPSANEKGGQGGAGTCHLAPGLGLGRCFILKADISVKGKQIGEVKPVRTDARECLHPGALEGTGGGI